MPRSLADGRTISHYRVVSLIGAGGMGEVYLAEDHRLRRKVALKVLGSHLAADENRLNRFSQEARTIAAINHPNIITIFDVGYSDGVQFVATEFVEGETLRAYLNRQRFATGDALEVAAQITSALSAAHEAGVVHRDIKPENVMLRSDGLVKVLDFGLAKLTESELLRLRPDDDTHMLPETNPGVVLGTFSYMSPEQARGQAVDARSDIFSLGVVLYEMLTGQAPFAGSSAADLIAAIVYVDPPPVGRLTAVPPSVDQLLLRMLQKNRENRHPTANELLADIRSAQSDLSGGRPAFPSSFTLVREQPPILTPAAATTIAVPTAATMPRRRRLKRGIDSLAVLPLQNVSRDADAEYLSDGITESLINSLSQLPRLRVMARSTVFRYKGRDVDPQAAGRDMNVRAVLTGRIQQRGDTVVIGTELVDVDDGAQLWGAQFNRRASDVFVLQEELSAEITERLRLRLTGEEKRRLVKRHTVNPEAYQLYLRGRFFLNKRSADGLRNAFEQFQKAIDLDPGYALAHAGLADAYALAGAGYSTLPIKSAMARAKESAMRALEIDNQLPEAYASLAFVKFRFEWDWEGAERDFRRALELNPGHAPSHHWFAMFLGSRSRFDEALKEMERARELDPLSPVMLTGTGRILHFAGRYDEALALQRQALQMEPGFVSARFDIGMTLVALGRLAEAGEEFEIAAQATGYAAPVTLVRAVVAQMEGRADEARAFYDQLVAKHREEGHGRGVDDLAMLAALLGDFDAAYEWLQQACEAHASILAYVNVEPLVAPLRDEPRCRALLQKYGLVPRD